jgi:hypothetical protein
VCLNEVCVRANRYGNKVRVEALGQVKLTGQTSPEISLLLAEGGRGPQRQVFVDGVKSHRIGVRAFSTLEGYADRKRRNGVGFSGKDQENDRPPSRFSSEIGTKADAKQ